MNIKFLNKSILSSNIRTLLSKKVVKDYLAVFSSNIALRPVQFIKGYFIAKFLGPADYGLLKSLELVQMLNKYGNLGFNNAASREVGNAIGENDKARAQFIRNNVYTAEGIFTLTLFFIGLTGSIFLNSLQLSILIILASFGLLTSKFQAIFATEAAIQKKFVLISKIVLITTTLSSVIVIILVPFLKIYAVMLMNVMVGIFAIIYYLRALSFSYSFQLDKVEIKRILGISIPMMIGSLAYGSYRYAERLLILGFIGDIALGFYGFGFMIINQFSILFKAAVKVRTQDLYEAIGRKDFLWVHKTIKRESGLLVGAAIIVIPLIWLALDFLIPLLLPQWIDGILYSKILICVLPLLVVTNYMAVVLISSLVNKQKIIPAFRFSSTLLLIAGTYYLDHLNLLTLERFIYLNIAGYAFYHISIIILYKRSFYNIYLR